MGKRVGKKKWKGTVAQSKGAEAWESVKGETILAEVHMEQLIRWSSRLAGPRRSAFINTNMLKNVYVDFVGVN